MPGGAVVPPEVQRVGVAHQVGHCFGHLPSGEATGGPHQPEDRHELYLQIRERLNEMRAYGMPVPEDLVKFEEELEAQFKAEDAGSKKS